MANKPTKTTWKPFDAADYITSEKDIALYLDAVMEEAADNPALLAHALGDVARARRNMSQLARDAGVTREGLYKALSREGNPSFATVARIAKALGLEIHFRPRKKVTKEQEKRRFLELSDRLATAGNRRERAQTKAELARSTFGS